MEGVVFGTAVITAIVIADDWQAKPAGFANGLVRPVTESDTLIFSI
jgi:hypothetical protein